VTARARRRESNGPEENMTEGDKAPEFELADQDGNTVKLADHAGETVVLYFYPRADTPGCTTQACGIRDRGDEYAAAGAVVLGVSPDEPPALRRFADKHGLPFTLLADPTS
jgi:peroxiredoxin Q/BCP